VEGVDDDIEQLLDLGLEFKGLWRGGGHGRWKEWKGQATPRPGKNQRCRAGPRLTGGPAVAPRLVGRDHARQEGPVREAGQANVAAYERAALGPREMDRGV